ncbi:unnamed protein product [Umbelopsis ramanniana]
MMENGYPHNFLILILLRLQMSSESVNIHAKRDSIINVIHDLERSFYEAQKWDSITELQYESLKCLLGEHFDTAKSSKNIKYHPKTLGLQNKTAVEYIRSDYLLRLDTWKLQKEGEEPGPLLAAHWHKSSIFGETETLDDMLQAYEYTVNLILDTVQQYPHLTTYFRSSPYGHGNCSQYTEPMVTPKAPNGTVPWEYAWHLFPKMSNMWKVCSDLASTKLSFVWAYKAN